MSTSAFSDPAASARGPHSGREPTPVAWVDGELVAESEVLISGVGHAVMRGSSVFDVLRIVQGPTGPAAVGLRPHLARFERSMALMGMTPKATLADLEQAVAEVVAANPDTVVIKTVAAWAEPSSGLLPASLVPRIMMVAVDESHAGGSLLHPQPVALASAHAPKLPPSTLPPELKVAASYLVGVRETMAAQARGFDGVVFRTTAGLLAESTTQSVIVVHTNRLIMPPLDTVLDSITRRMVIDVATHLGFHHEVRPVMWDELATADEVFLCSTNAPVAPVRLVDDLTFAAPGPVSAVLGRDVAVLLQGGDHPLANHWLTPLT